MFHSKNESPYIKYENRLADVLAAIQVMSIYKFYKLDFKSWSMRISGDESNFAYWKKVFEEHPEFFRFNSDEGKVSLAWRRSKQRRFHVDLNKEITLDQINNLPATEAKEKISRSPLNSSEVQSLIAVAIDLHTRAFENKKDSRWWVVPVISSISGLIGVLVGALIK
ncbi:hypothetical protein C7448_102409 [Tenacibaculum gallaicum]|uniref:N-carbamoyl-L-amino acid amidohydrolase n=1 Tax=Tenacibaculum gallaicum TaxID=561505 RepID=A0A3E0I8E9_9FLAO|nr:MULTISPECIES: N-carbamoyl-L-amino acid amidohydrolase [Tenacibaculum]MDO6676511.1 N-carbamoyl-L-amino acid amidohydrolase [Tenacibaculum sp. 1_MG-2023]REH54881.1 hypothetical protein C7448_102409 [Tenacibaculum gallaicum]